MSMRVEYRGFISGEVFREYTLLIQDGAEAARSFVVAIPNAAFSDRRARFQDAPDICFQKVLKALGAVAQTPLTDRLSVSDEDLEDYKKAHTVKARVRNRPKPHAAHTADNGDGTSPGSGGFGRE
jgi:hypothetical protein